jgi:hypothetical protein
VVFDPATQQGRIALRRTVVYEPMDVISMPGVFDPEGEPEIRKMRDGSLYLVFNFMPPSWADDNPDAFDDFDEQLAAATGQAVSWEDREFFRIDRPGDDTVDRIRQFLVGYPRSG